MLAFSTQWDITQEKEPASAQRYSVEGQQASCYKEFSLNCSRATEMQSNLQSV